METSTCANYGKGEEESNNLKSCVACKMVKYCNRDCQIAHRPMHKKACKKRAAELGALGAPLRSFSFNDLSPWADSISGI